MKTQTIASDSYYSQADEWGDTAFFSSLSDAVYAALEMWPDQFGSRAEAVEFCRLHDQPITREAVEDICPWASAVVEVDGGWMAFESQADYETWENQK